MKRTLIAAALAIATIASSHAATITGLVNTGTGDAGTLDTNYALTSHSSDTTLAAGYGYVTGGTGFPFDYWTANTATSKWITPTLDQGQTFDASTNGSYTYELKFNLA